MKQKLNYLFPLVILLTLVAGCVKNTSTPVVLPVGNFAGTFTRLHLNPFTNKIDTITAKLNIPMSAANGYSVTGDTTHHAASHGTYIVDGVNIQFSDITFPTNTSAATLAAKTHLSGIYQYVYSAPSLIIQFSNDTLVLNYTLAAQ
jgi:hypothetical protein